MLTRSCAQSQVENYQYKLKIIKTYQSVRVLRQNLTFLILLVCIDARKLRGIAFLELLLPVCSLAEAARSLLRFRSTEAVS